MKYRIIIPVIAVVLSCLSTGCTKSDNVTSSSENSTDSNSTGLSFGREDWEQTIPGNIVGKYSTIPGVPLYRNINGKTYTYAWAEEYQGTELNERDWQYEVNGNGGGNKELQYYIKENGVVSNDLLTIYGKKEQYGGKQYTSARMTTQDKVYFHYGYVEARILLPSFKGAWPAFWMLGQSYKNIGWSACGELDILEAVNADQYVHSTLHYGANHQQTTVGKYAFPSFLDRMDWHDYEMIWDEKSITTYVDGIQIGEISIEASKFASFHEDFFFIVNFAIGGTWPGSVEATAFNVEQVMQVDYIRVYQEI